MPLQTAKDKGLLHVQAINRNVMCWLRLTGMLQARAMQLLQDAVTRLLQRAVTRLSSCCCQLPGSRDVPPDGCSGWPTRMQSSTVRWKEGGPQEASRKGTKGCRLCTRE